jgi:hypothetical protein
VSAQRAGEAVADQLSPLARHQRRRDTVPRVVVDPGQGLGGRAVAEQEATDDVHLPQLHRATPLAALPHLTSTLSGHRLDDSGSNQTPVHLGLRRNRVHALLGQLERQTPRTPIRPGPPHLEHRCLELGRHLVWAARRPVRPVAKPFEALRLVPREPGVHGLPAHPPPRSPFARRRRLPGPPCTAVRPR